MLAEMPKNNGGRPTENQSHDTTGFQTLSDIEITRDQSSRWQKLAAVLPSRRAGCWDRQKAGSRRVGGGVCLEIAWQAAGAGDLNYSDDDPEHDKEHAEKQEFSDDSDSVLPAGRNVLPRHELTSG
jgi:hypothetical protein